MPVYGSNGQIGWHNEALVKGPGIVIGRKGNPGTISWAQTDFFPIDTTFYVIPKGNPNCKHYLFHTLSSLNLSGLASDSAVPGLNRKIAYRAGVLVAPENVLNVFESIAKVLSLKTCLNNKQAKLLGSIVNILLPRLMTGKIRVPICE